VTSKRFWFPPNEVIDKDGKKIGELEVTREEAIYGFDDVPRSEYLIIVESIFNKNTLGVHAVATCGAHLSRGQLSRIKAIGPKTGVVLAPDNDVPGLESILTNGPKLADKGYKVFWSIPPYLEYEKNGEKCITKDWNELYTDVKLTKPQIVVTMNQRLVPFTEKSRLQLRQMVFRQGKAQKHVHRSSFFS
jgi:hypothetical protein